MIAFLPESVGRVLGVQLSELVTRADYEIRLIPKLEQLIAEHGKLNLLFYMDASFCGWELGAAWDDATFGFGHRADFEKIAVVGGPPWVAWSVKCAAFLIRGEVRTFASDRLQEAWIWVEAGVGD